MQNTSTTKTGTVEFMPSKGKLLGQGVRAQPALTTLSYTVTATLEMQKLRPGQPKPKKPSNRLKVVIKVGQRGHEFTEKWESDKLPSSGRCKKWAQQYMERLLPDDRPTKIKLK